MSHFAHINENNIVDNVIVADQYFIDTGAICDPAEWVQTSYNTHGGKHPENRPLRKNYAGIDYKYDKIKDAFIPPKPFESWILNEETCLWEAPVPYPDDGKLYMWNESTLVWDLIIEG